MTQQTSLLASYLQIKPSKLYVRDIQKMTHFYRDIVGLDSLVATNSHAILGHHSHPVLELISKPEYNNAPIKSAGLFHNAILYSSSGELARTIYNILQRAPWSYEGSADHLVSEAFYFHDPENNGLELYVDRPRDTWGWDGDMIRMDTLYLSPEKFILEHIHDQAQDKRELGHVHLRVGDIGVARKFYVDQLGFDTTADMGSALFVSVGGYHHHMAMNTWQSAGAGKREPGLGLAEIKLVLPGDGSIDTLSNRLQAQELPFQQKNDTLTIDDPWGNRLLLTAE